MIKRRRPPCAGGVARRAVARKICCHVIGITRVLKIRLMARETIHGRARVAIIRMALIACHCKMRAGERKARAIMIEGCRSPHIVVVAQQAVLRIVISNMIRIRRALKIILMAREAILRRARETIVHMTLCAIDGAVRTEQWKRRAAVIKTLPAETGKLPTGNHTAMALLAAQRKSCLLMIGIRRGFIVFHMTRAALQRQVDELRCAALRVTIIATHVLMTA